MVASVERCFDNGMNFKQKCKRILTKYFQTNANKGLEKVFEEEICEVVKSYRRTYEVLCEYLNVASIHVDIVHSIAIIRREKHEHYKKFEP